MHIFHLDKVLDVAKWQEGFSFLPQLFTQQKALLHLVAVENNQVQARCSLWLPQQELDGKKLGVIGHYAASEDEAANRVLDEACTWLQQAGCQIAVGPMDGNTWRTYRFVIEQGTEPPFFGEPQNPSVYPQQFSDAGFTIFARYSSILCDDLTMRREHIERVETRLENECVVIRSLCLDNWDAELEGIYNICAVSFRHNLLYKPLSRQEFMEQYANVKNMLIPELVLMAECKNQLVGFCFSYPDFLQRQRNETLDTVVIKTIATLPQRRLAGLGNVMAEKTHRISQNMGFRRVIHALMYDGNVSLHASTHYGATMRRYALFVRDLTQ